MNLRKVHRARRLIAHKESGVIEIDTATALSGVPPEAWRYQLGTYSALEWVLERYKEREPREEPEMSEEQPQEPRTIVDEIEVEGRELVARVQELIREGNVRKVRVKDSKGRYLLEIPLTAGVVLGGVIALSSPPMLALSVLAGFVAKIEVEVIREVPESRLEESADAEKKEE